MVQFIIGILLLLFGIIFGIAVKIVDEHNGGTITATVIAIILGVVLLIVSFFTVLPTGYTGILTTFGRVEDASLEAGFRTKLPWQEVVQMDNREQKENFDLEAFSKDIQETKVALSVNYALNKEKAQTLYKGVGVKYSEILIAPRVKETTKNVMSKYNAEELISKRDALSNQICEALNAELNDYGLDVFSVSVEDIDFTDAFTNAVEAKQVATQDKLRAQTQQEQKTMEAQQAAERDKIEANAKAEVQKIEADAAAYAVKIAAEAQAEANEKVNKSITNELIDYVYATNWDGKMPTTMVGGDVKPMLPLTTNEGE